MSRLRSFYLVTGAIASVLAVAPVSFAQPRAPVRGVPVDHSTMTIYRFDDDPLMAGNLPQGPTLRVQDRAARQTILRPRASLVVPLVRSVEAIGDTYERPLEVRLPRR